MPKIGFTAEMLEMIAAMKGKTFKSYKCRKEAGGKLSATFGRLRINLGRSSIELKSELGLVEDFVGGPDEVATLSCEKVDPKSAFVPYFGDRAVAYMVDERMTEWDGVCAAGSTAAAVHGIGDFWLSPYRLLAPRRMRTRNSEVNISMRKIDRADVAFDVGLPVTRVERTLVDLVLDDEDPSLVEDALRDAQAKGLDEARLRELCADQPARVAKALLGDSRPCVASNPWAFGRAAEPVSESFCTRASWSRQLPLACPPQRAL